MTSALFSGVKSKKIEDFCEDSDDLVGFRGPINIMPEKLHYKLFIHKTIH